MFDYYPPAEVRPYLEERCEMYTWRTDAYGIIRVSNDAGPEFAPTLGETQGRLATEVKERWGPVIDLVAPRWGVPSNVIVAMVYRESGGNPDAVNHSDNPPGLGLMQITSPALYTGLTREQVMKPRTNLEIGTKYVADLVRRYGQDWPLVFAAYNAGSARRSTANLWGLVCTRGHVDAEVAAFNYLRLKELDDIQQEAQKACAMHFDLYDLSKSRKPDESS